MKRFGKLNCVVNNAGASGEGGPIAGTSFEGFDRSIALLLRGPFLGIKYAVPHMENGTIINIASVAGVAGGYGPHAYTAAKFGVFGLTKSVALGPDYGCLLASLAILISLFPCFICALIVLVFGCPRC